MKNSSFGTSAQRFIVNKKYTGVTHLSKVTAGMARRLLRLVAVEQRRVFEYQRSLGTFDEQQTVLGISGPQHQIVHQQLVFFVHAFCGRNKFRKNTKINNTTISTAAAVVLIFFSVLTHVKVGQMFDETPARA